MLSPSELMDQQALLGSGYAAFVQVEALVESGLRLIVMATDTDAEVALLTPYSDNLNTADSYRTAWILQEATLALERHITDRSGQTFNDYLFTRSLKVTQDFATLSMILGATIDPKNIQ